MQIVKGHWQLIAITLAVFVLWQTPLMLPLKILVVFMHELSHAIAAWITGGSVESISVSPRQGGLTVTRGGNGFLLTSAGYIGSLLIGVLLFTAALRSRADRQMMAVLGVVMLVVTGLYMREIFALAFGVAAGAAMLASARFLSARVNDLALRVIGLTSMVYVPFDIFDDTIARSGAESDAYAMSQTYGGPVMFWGGLWLLLSLLVIWNSLRRLGRNSNI